MTSQVLSIRKTIDDLLQLIETSSASGLEPSLIRLLDKLAYEVHGIEFVFDEREFPNPPSVDHQLTRSRVESLFPRWVYLPESPINDITPDPHGDLEEILSDLMDVRWRWENASEMDALRDLKFGFQTHWGRHLRLLQLYLHDLS